jgi:hypothetical protein
LGGLDHWARDSLFAIPLAALVIGGVNLATRGLWSGGFVARLHWALLVGLGYSIALVPGGIGHGRLFPAERHAGEELAHALNDAITLFPATIYTALAIAFLWGIPSDLAAPAGSVIRAVRNLEWCAAFQDGLRRVGVIAAVAALIAVIPTPAAAGSTVVTAAGADPVAAYLADGTCKGNITADVVALDQAFYYNRLGAINANGMMYALRSDVVDNFGLTEAEGGTLEPGLVALRPDKRPRPLTLRMNEGDCLSINFTNLLGVNPFNFDLPDNFPTDQILGLGVPIDPQIDDQPLTRKASIHVDGLELVGGIASDGSNVGRNGDAGDGLVDPGASITYTYYAAARGTNLLYSMGSTVGAEGGGGTRSYGLFGAVNVEPVASDWYRSQLTRQEMDWATPAEELLDTNGDGVATLEEGFVDTNEDGVWNEHRTTPGGQPMLDYFAVYPAEAGLGKVGRPIVSITQPFTGPDGSTWYEIVHSDLNAIIDDRDHPYPPNDAYPTRGDEPFREFTVIFHDESFGVQAFPGFYNDPVLEHTLHGVRDSFPINYGSGGIGSEIIANRLGVGPMWDCSECKYEEFFLTSFTVGDPAMIVDIPANTTDATGNIIPGAKATKALYPDDPSNVHHSYLGDRVVYRNVHAGPKEHHIFHLHAHQWQANPDDPESSYLDGQALGPGSGYSYEIAYGGSGNRNLTAGDSIFHCHFYPHFAQGMWELWRVHDVFEQGTAMNPDGTPADGSRALPDGEIVAGTPIPGVVPMPGIAMALMPNAEATVTPSDLNDDGIFDSSQFDANGDGTADIEQTADASAAPSSNPGYPFFTPGLVGHRPPTPALDLLDDGGLPRHVVTSGPEEDNPDHAGPAIESYVSRLDFNKVLHEASAIQIPEGGTPAEQVAMEFHAGPNSVPAGGSDPLRPYDPTYDSYLPSGLEATGPNGFEVNGLPAVRGAPFADPCRTDRPMGPRDPVDDYVGVIEQNRTIKGANIEMPVTLNKVGWYFQQQRFEALWEDVVPTLTNARAPEPMVMRLNSTDCAEFQHANLVPNVYQLDDYQVRTPTDIIGQHIHLVKFDVMSADGSANGWNYEDGTLSPDEVRERMEAFNNGGGLVTVALDPDTGLPALDGVTQLPDIGLDTALTPEAHPFFGATGPTGQNWLGARTTIQRWYADPLLERSWDGGVGTVFTHDHYGPSTHQQVGLYSTLLVEPEGSIWRHNETGELLGTRLDGGPTTWQAIIEPGGQPGDAEFDAHREFYFEFADFQHAYEAGSDALHTQSNENLLGPSIDIPSYADFDDAINPSFRQQPANAEDIFLHPNACEGPNVGEVLLARPCPEAISADDPGTYALNFRNEPIGLRVFNGETGTAAGQTPGPAGDLAFAYQSRTDRAIPELNSQPDGPYPALTADIQPGDPWTPMMRTYMGDQVRIRAQVGAHEEEHNFTIPGLKWRLDSNVENSGWKNSIFFGIYQYFNLDIPIVPDTASGTPARVDYIYTVGAELEGMWNGVWGILRSYSKERGDLYEIQDVGRNGYAITNEAQFDGICPVDAPVTYFDVTAVRSVDILGPNGIVYNDRVTALTPPLGGVAGVGPLIDPTALMYVLNEDLTYDPVSGIPNGLQPGTPVEPLVLRVNAGDCVKVNLANALPADLGATEMPGSNALPPIVHKDENADGAGGITTFNANDLTPSSYVGLTPQLLAFDPRTDGEFSTGLSTGKLVEPGGSEIYKWYAGDVTVDRAGVKGNRTQFTLAASPVEFGAAGLMPADRTKGTENSFVGAMVVEPQSSCWITDPDTRVQATVSTGDGLAGECDSVPETVGSFRDFVTVMQNDVNLRYGGGVCDPTAPDTQIATMDCAVPSIAAEGPLGAPEDPQDTGQKAINYGADPLWYRLGITPDTPFGEIHRNPALVEPIADVFSNTIDGVNLGDPQTQVFRASPNGPEYGRFRVVMPGGHARGAAFTVHGHNWQRMPYQSNSSVIGDNPQSDSFGVQQGVNPTGHWDFVVDLGGSFDVQGDYLFGDQGSFGSYQGLWGLLRYDDTAPVVGAASVSVAKYDLSDINLLELAFDLDGDAESATFTQPTFGTLTDNGDGTVTYNYPEGTAWPCADDPLECAATFTFTVSDAGGLVSNEGTFTVNVTNTAPVAVNDTSIIKTPATEGAVDVLANDSDAEGDLAPAREPVVTLVGQPVDRAGVQVGTIADAALGLDGRTLTYTPPSGFMGVALIEYTVTDESGAVSAPAFIRVAVNVDDITITEARFQPQNGQWTVSGTCTDPFLPSGAPTMITIYSGPTITPPGLEVGSAPCEPVTPVGTWRFQGQATAAAPPSPLLFNLVSAESELEGFYEGAPVAFAGHNNAPVANPDVYSTYEDVALNGDVLANDADADFDPLTAVLVADVANGTLVLDADGTFTYTPDLDWSGDDSFTYRADDGKDLSGIATVGISVEPVNDIPRAGDDTYVIAVDLVLIVAAPGVLGNDIDVEGISDLGVDTGSVTGPSNGSLSIAADGSFTYTPNPSFVGADEFWYRVCEDLGGGDELCDVAMVTVTVGNSAPVANDDAYDAVQNQALEIFALGVLGNDADAELDPLAASLVSGTAHGSVTLSADGSFTYVPVFNFIGVDSFTYTAADLAGAVSNVATVTINVDDVVAVTSATYRLRQQRWNIQGTVSASSSSVDVYLNGADLIGSANVDGISGDWSFTGSTPVVASQGDTVIAVSSGGGESASTPVTLRR